MQFLWTPCILFWAVIDVDEVANCVKYIAWDCIHYISLNLCTHYIELNTHLNKLSDKQTDGQTDGPTDIFGYRATIAAKKNIESRNLLLN